VSIGNSKQRNDRKHYHSKLPGPGNYDSKLNDDSTKYSLGIRRNNKIGNNVPGPGEYNDDIDKFKYYSSPKLLLNSRSNKFHYKNNPGPGQ